MPLTAAQYKTAFETQLNTGDDFAVTKPESCVAHGQIASVYAYLYVEKTKLDDESITPSAAANAYATSAESALTSAIGYASGWTAKPAAAVAWATVASTWAYAFINQARLDA